MRNATWGALGVLAVAATVGISLQPGASRSGERNSRARQVTAKRARAETSGTTETDSERACDDIAQALQVFLAIEKVPRPKACFSGDSSRPHDQTDEQTTGKEPPRDLTFVVATLPDPVHTHLALLFDRMAEVIQDAAQDEGYSYEASWLPWEDKEQTYTHLADEDQAGNRKELREDEPGVLVFRNGLTGSPIQQGDEPESKSSGRIAPASAAKRSDQPDRLSNSALLPYRKGLIVFVVGEDPTRGIHTEQFKNALAWIEELKGPDVKSRARAAILGPVFSGSFPSLAKLLSGGESGGYLKEIRGNSSSPLSIYSGTANSGKAILGFEKASHSDSSLRNLDIDFHAFLERDEVGLERFCEYVGMQKQSFGPEAIAVISEDETAYGGNGEGSDQKACLSRALWLYYPRDISSLRAAYQTNSIFNTTAPQQSSDAGRARLPTDLADPEGEEHDTIRSYAGNQTPLSQEAYLLGIVNAMRVRHSQYVILRSTNPLDQLFLARYLRRAYPDARIVTDGADRLFERERGTTGMGGTMSLSTYPLLEIEQEWIDGKAPSGGQRLFNSDTSEGTYIAFRLLLHSPALSQYSGDPCALPREKLEPDSQIDTIAGSLNALPEDCVPLPDYGLPSWMADGAMLRRPATWLSVLGKDGYWAIAAMNEETLHRRTAKGYFVNREYHSEAPLSLRLWLIFLAGFCLFHLWCCWRASFTAKPAFRAHFANPGDWRHTVLVLLGSLFLAILPLLAGWGCGLFGSSSMLSHPWLVGGVVFLECLTALAASVVNILRVEKLSKGGTLNPAGRRIEGRKLVALVCGASALWIVFFFRGYVHPLQWFLLPANQFFTQYRNVHILSGVSPIVPLLALAIGMYLWFWHALHGLALFGTDRCVLPAEYDLRVPGPADENDRNKAVSILPMFSREAATDTERGARPLARGAVILALVLFASMVVIVRTVSRGWPVRSLGAEYYAKYFLWWLLACFSLVLMEAWQLLRTWTKLRALLVFLDRSPFRRTLAALRGFSWGSVWGMSGNVLDVRYKLLSRQLESLGHVRSALNDLAVKKASDAARCCIAARYSIAVLAKLKQGGNDKERLALADECLDALKQLRKSTTGHLREKLDAARDCIVAQKLGTVMLDPAATAGVQECISALEEFVSLESSQAAVAERECVKALDSTRKTGMEFAVWYAENYKEGDAGNLKPLEAFQASVAKTAATLLIQVLLPEWREEKNSLVLVEAKQSSDDDDSQQISAPLSEKQHIRDAEEFVCLPYLGFVQNILGRMRSMVMSIVWLFVAAAAAISSYPFDPRQGLSGTMLAFFLLLGAVIFYVYAQMHRDTTLSHVTNTTPGKLGGEFWFKLVGFGIAPLLGLLTTIFPGITDFVFSWLQPGLQSIK